MKRSKFPIEKSVFVRCTGGCETVELRSVIDRFGKESDETFHQFEFSIWSYGRHSSKLSWRERLRWCWNILRNGNLWADEVILSEKSVKKLSDFTLTEINKHNKLSKATKK